MPSSGDISNIPQRLVLDLLLSILISDFDDQIVNIIINLADNLRATSVALQRKRMRIANKQEIPQVFRINYKIQEE